MSLPRLPQARNIPSAMRRLRLFNVKRFALYTIRTVIPWKKKLFFPSVLAGRCSASAPYFAFFKDKMLESTFAEGLGREGKGSPFPPHEERR